ncbi:MAG: hypothetical protein KJZ78_15655, partial [Bryobacteraceae bacterium]|nr:hypothetical protein [Bryobacteraceae bacterium]
EDGVAVEVEGQTQSVAIARNTLVETRQPASRIGVRIGRETKNITLADNRIDGFSVPVQDLRQT